MSQRAAPVLFGPGGAAASDGTGPTASGIAQSVQRIGPDRWPRVVADAAEQADAAIEVKLPPGEYFSPLVPLMNAILAARPGDDVSVLRGRIGDAFHAKGDTVGGNQVNSVLSDLIDPAVTVADRRSAADELSHYAAADPEQVAQFRAGLVDAVLGDIGAISTAEKSAPEALPREAAPGGAVEKPPLPQRLTLPVRELSSAGKRDAHHVIQDAAVRDLPGYDTNAAPGVQLAGPSTAVGSAHYNATQVQRNAVGGTYGEERKIAYDALKAAGYSDSAAAAAVREADDYFETFGVLPDTVTRIPGNRRRK